MTDSEIRQLRYCYAGPIVMPQDAKVVALCEEYLRLKAAIRKVRDSYVVSSNQSFAKVAMAGFKAWCEIDELLKWEPHAD